jgi:hypothetical protein
MYLPVPDIAFAFPGMEAVILNQSFKGSALHLITESGPKAEHDIVMFA